MIVKRKYGKNVNYKKLYDLQKEYWSLTGKDKENFFKFYKQLFMSTGLPNPVQYPNILLPNGSLTQSQGFPFTTGMVGGIMVATTSYQCKVPYKLACSMNYSIYSGTPNNQTFYMGILVRDSIVGSTIVFNTPAPASATVGNYVWVGSLINNGNSYSFLYPLVLGNGLTLYAWPISTVIGLGPITFVIQELTANNIQVSYNGNVFVSANISGNTLNGIQRSIGLMVSTGGIVSNNQTFTLIYNMITSPI